MITFLFSILIVKRGIFTFFKTRSLWNPVIVKIIHVDFLIRVGHFDGRKWVLGWFTTCFLGRLHWHNTRIAFITPCSRFHHWILRHYWLVHHWCSKWILFALCVNVLYLLDQVSKFFLILFGSLFLFCDIIVTFLLLLINNCILIHYSINLAFCSFFVHLNLPSLSIGSHLSCSLPIELHPIDVHPVNIVLGNLSVEVGVLSTLRLHSRFHHHWSLWTCLRVIDVGHNTCVN